MKQIIVSFFCVVFIGNYCNAQSDQKSVNKKRTGIQATSSNNKRYRSSIDTFNNTRNYKWKDGQTATPTGEEATGTNTERFVSNKKDSLKLKATKKKQ